MAQDRAYFVNRWAALKNERNSYIEHWREISDYLLPRRSRFLVTDAQRAGSKRNDKILNGNPTRYLGVLASGMMTGITSPARPWFRLITADPALNDEQDVRDWLHQVEQRLYEIFARSNVYNALHELYSDLAAFGTSTLWIDEDDEEVLRAYVFPIGSYAIANDAAGRVCALYREYRMTAGQIIEMFGEESCSETVKTALRGGRLDEPFSVVHALEANRDPAPGRDDAEGKPWLSIWYESSTSSDKLLRKSGYDTFPVMAPRWSVTGEEVYGSSPGMNALGDCKGLQLLARRSGQILDKIANPPMVAPTGLRNDGGAKLYPGGISYYDGGGPGQFQPLYVPDARAYQINEDIARQHEQRISGCFLADIFSMFAGNMGTMTAREVEERHEEKLLQLGPVLERLHNELLNPLIDRAFSIMVSKGMLPIAPKVLQGQPVRVEYVSILAQAQKLVAVLQLERLFGFVAGLSKVSPQVVEKVDWDAAVDEYAKTIGVAPNIVLGQKEVATVRARRLQAEQQMAEAQQAATARDAATAAKTAAETRIVPDNAYRNLASQMGAPGQAAA